jgi:hypothetical protein
VGMVSGRRVPPTPPPPPPPPPPPEAPAEPAPPTDAPIETPAGPPAVTVFQEVPPSPEELARQAGVETDAPAEPEPAPEPDRLSSASQGVIAPGAEPAADAEPVAVTDAVRHEFDAGRLVAIEIEEAGAVTRLVRGDDGWSVHPG